MMDREQFFLGFSNTSFPGDALPPFGVSLIDEKYDRGYGVSIPAVVVSLVLIIHYRTVKTLFTLASKQEADLKSPPLVPHWVPFLGSLPFAYFWNARSFVCSSKYLFQSGHPVRVKLFFRDFYVLQGTRNISTLFKQRSLSAFAVHGSLLRYVFALPEAAVRVYHSDDSGEHEKPHEDSLVEPHNRVDFLTRSSFHKLLTGPGLAPLSRRFKQNVTACLATLCKGQEWTEIEDFMHIFQHNVTAAVIDAMCGTYLLENHPGFLRDFWMTDHNVTKLFMRTPRILASNAYKARDRALLAVKAWHLWAKSNFELDSVGPDGDDPYWGTRFFRERQNMFLGMDGFDPDAVASQELAFIWGANTNSIISAFWAALEVFRDENLLHEIRKEVQACIQPETTGDISFDIPMLLKQPHLQAVFAETLRLRVNGYLVRRPMRQDLRIREWVLPKDKFCLTSSTPGHMDPNIWCNGPNQDHPPEEFWPNRFLRSNKFTNELEFSLSGTEGSWMPFGGGIHMCPGKTFAKQIICYTVALMVTKYDCKVVASEESMGMNMRNFGLGTLSPSGKVPVLIRERQED